MHGKRFEGIEGANEKGFTKSERRKQERTAGFKGKISQAHNKCVPLYSYIHSTQCCSHVFRLLTQVHVTITYFLHFRSNDFNYFASKLPKVALSQEIRARLEFLNFQK
jgi:hypothetical protein